MLSSIAPKINQEKWFKLQMCARILFGRGRGGVWLSRILKDGCVSKYLSPGNQLSLKSTRRRTLNERLFGSEVRKVKKPKRDEMNFACSCFLPKIQKHGIAEN